MLGKRSRIAALPLIIGNYRLISLEINAPDWNECCSKADRLASQIGRAIRDQPETVGFEGSRCNLFCTAPFTFGFYDSSLESRDITKSDLKAYLDPHILEGMLEKTCRQESNHELKLHWCHFLMGKIYS